MHTTDLLEADGAELRFGTSRKLEHHVSHRSALEGVPLVVHQFCLRGHGHEAGLTVELKRSHRSQ